jgi:hypothetical protein
MIASLFIKFPTGHERSEEILSETRALVMNILLGGYIYIYPQNYPAFGIENSGL